MSLLVDDLPLDSLSLSFSLVRKIWPLKIFLVKPKLVALNTIFTMAGEELSDLYSHVSLDKEKVAQIPLYEAMLHRNSQDLVYNFLGHFLSRSPISYKANASYLLGA